MNGRGGAFRPPFPFIEHAKHESGEAEIGEHDTSPHTKDQKGSRFLAGGLRAYSVGHLDYREPLGNRGGGALRLASSNSAAARTAVGHSILSCHAPRSA